MFDIACKRLFWKEFRTQWQVWVALVFGAFLLQLLFLVMGNEFQKGGQEYPFQVALVLTVCYGVTSMAILFAGEREEQTDDWLRQLPVTTGRLVAGKVTFTIISVIAFAAFVFSLGAVTKSMAWHAPPGVSKGWQQAAVGFLQGSGGLLLWSLFYSLILSRVMTVLIAGVSTQLLIAFVFGNFMPGPYEAWQAGIAVCVAIADVWLAKEWLSGRSVAPLFEGMANPARGRVMTGRRSRLWLKGVTWAASHTPVASRSFAVLVWRELRSAVPFTIAWGLFGILMVDLLVRAWGGGTNAIWLLATPLVCGLMSLTGDQSRQTFRFLTNRGLNPLMVWLTKHIVWLPLAIGLVLVVGYYDVVADFRSPEHNESFALGLIQEFGPRGGVVWMSPETRVTLAMSLVCSLGLTLYVVGHLCALWIRRTVVSASVACVCGVVLLAWHVVLIEYDVSLGLTTWPLVAVLWLASLMTVGGWLLETATWRRKLAKAAWVVLPVCGVIGSALYWRATQIPVVDPGFDWQQHAKTTANADPQWSHRWRHIFTVLNISYARHTEEFSERRWQDFLGNTDKPAEAQADDQADDERTTPDAAASLEAFGGVGSISGMGGSAEPHDPWDDLLNEELSGYETLTTIRSLADELREQQPSISLRLSVNVLDDVWAYQMLSIRGLGQVIVEAAAQQRQQGDLDEAWAILNDGLTLTSYLPSQMIHTQNLMGCWNARQLILQEIHAWAADAEQTPERLQQAREELDTLGILNSLFAKPMWKNRYVYYRQILEEFDTSKETFLNSQMISTVSTWPTERERIIRLMSVITAGWLNPDPRTTSEAQLSQYGWPGLNARITPRVIDRWQSTTPLLPYDFQLDSLLDIRPVATAEAATHLILRLHLHRLEHGGFPETLNHLRTADDTDIPRDPVTNHDFGYSPTGFPAPVLIAQGRHGHEDEFVLPPNTPLLWIPGSTPPTSKLDGKLLMLQQVHFADNSRYLDIEKRAAERFAGDGDDAELKQARSRRLMFVNVGHRPW